MPEDFKVEIISPAKIIFKGSANLVTIPSFEGEMGVLKNHIPIVTFLRPGFVEIIGSQKKEKFFLEEGIVEFSNDTLLILSSTVKNSKEFSKDEIQEQIDKATKDLNLEDCTDKEKYILSYKIEGLKNISQ